MNGVICRLNEQGGGHLTERDRHTERQRKRDVRRVSAPCDVFTSASDVIVNRSRRSQQPSRQIENRLCPSVYSNYCLLHIGITPDAPAALIMHRLR